jgi:DNA-binding LytR/AlgR family response regulator
MRILIIEDEVPAAEKLRKMLIDQCPAAQLSGPARSIKEGLAWLRQHPLPDLIFSDIELLDGPVFQLFDQFKVTCPIIFTTAYDQFLLKAFQVNGIAYLLKPFTEEQLAEALAKYERLFGGTSDAFLSPQVIADLKKALQPAAQSYRNRFAIKRSNGIVLLSVEEVSFIQSEDNVVLAYTDQGKRYPLNFTLTELEEQLDPARFFRLNRGAIVALAAIERIEPYFNDRLAVTVGGGADHLVTSAGRTPAFRKWVEG